MTNPLIKFSERFEILLGTNGPENESYRCPHQTFGVFVMRYVFVVLLLCAVGCGQMADMEKSVVSRDSTASPAESMGWDSDASKSFSSKAENEARTEPSKAIANRKIIYTASMDVVVEQFDGVEAKLNSLVESHGGFIASANIGRMQGESRNGYWTVRVPVDEYTDFLNSVGNIGVPASRTQSASDVTEEYVDIEARITNKRKLEARIIELLERPEDKLQHVIEVERELARVREDIERMEGRLRYLKDQTSLTTVTVNIREERNYIPPQTPTISNRVSSAWSTSLINGRAFFENLVVAAAGNALGFGIFLLGLLIAIPVLRRLYRFLQKSIGKNSAAETSSQV
jgi:uncharacterized coiled-coil protein SlyX